MRDKQDPGIPKNADKVLFAEDFVNHFLHQFMIPRLSSGIEEYRSVVYNAFNSTVRVAADCLYKRLEKVNMDEYEYILGQHPLNGNSLMSYVTSIELELLSKGFDAQKLLHFCVKTTTMAIRFCCSGFDEAPALAVQRIINILENYLMTLGGWDRVNVIAESYARIYADVDSAVVFGLVHQFCSESSSDSDDYSEASDSVIATTQGANGAIKDNYDQKFPRHALDSESSDSSDEEYSDAVCSELTSSDESINQDLQMVIPSLPSKNIPLVDKYAETSSDDEVKSEDVQQGSGTSGSVSKGDTDEEWDYDVFEDSLDEVTPCDQFGRESAMKRPASSGSSTGEFPKSPSPEQSETCLMYPAASTSNEDLNKSAKPTSSAGTSYADVSPVRKHVAKARKKF